MNAGDKYDVLKETIGELIEEKGEPIDKAALIEDIMVAIDRSKARTGDVVFYEKQFDKLTKFLLKHHNDFVKDTSWSSESPVEVAIRLLEEYQKADEDEWNSEIIDAIGVLQEHGLDTTSVTMSFSMQKREGKE